jgi:hypothetical protein
MAAVRRQSMDLGVLLNMWDVRSRTITHGRRRGRVPWRGRGGRLDVGPVTAYGFRPPPCEPQQSGREQGLVQEQRQVP